MMLPDWIYLPWDPVLKVRIDYSAFNPNQEDKFFSFRFYHQKSICLKVKMTPENF